MNKILNIILIVLCCHLLYTNAELLVATKTIINNITLLDRVLLSCFALSYSLLTCIAIMKIKNLIFILIFAIMDGVAVYLRINVEQEHFLLISSVYYGLYTAYIICISHLIFKKEATQSAPGTQTETPETTPKTKRKKAKKALPQPNGETLESEKVFKQLTMFE